MKKIKLLFSGLMIGFINALFGAGGGIIAVALLKKEYNDQKKAQATAVSVILPITVITAIRYITLGYTTFKEALPYILPGFLGAIVGSKILKKANNKLLKTLFSCIMLWAGVRLILK